MWTLLRTTPAVALAVLAMQPSAASAQTANGYNYGNPSGYVYNNNTYSSGLYLPQVVQPTGQDEVRAADGTTCRSSMAGNDAYLDIGGLGGQGADGQFNNGTVYGRVIVPLGETPRRVDCSALYNLEISRLKHELEMVRSGLAGGGSMQPMSAMPSKASWSEQGWSDGAAAKAAAGKGKPKTQTESAPASPPASSRDGVVPNNNAPVVRSTASVNRSGIVVPTSSSLQTAATQPEPNYLGATTAAAAYIQKGPAKAEAAAEETEAEVLPWSAKETPEAAVPQVRRSEPTPGEMYSPWGS